MRWYRLGGIAAILLFLLTHAGAVFGPACAGDISVLIPYDEEEYSVYADVLWQRDPGILASGIPAPEYVIAAETTNLEGMLWGSGIGAAGMRFILHAGFFVPSDLSDDFIGKNSRSYALDAPVRVLGKRVTILNRSDVEKLSVVQDRFWNEFYAQHPHSGGFIHVSRVGFDKHRMRALLYCDYTCGMSCGAGSLMLLVRENGEWVIVAESQLWAL